MQMQSLVWSRNQNETHELKTDDLKGDAVKIKRLQTNRKIRPDLVARQQQHGTIFNVKTNRREEEEDAVRGTALKLPEVF